MDINKISSMPQVEVSFQDQFSGSSDEITYTVRYIFERLVSQSFRPKIGMEILLYERNKKPSGLEYYICSIGKIIELDITTANKFAVNNLHVDTVSKIENTPVRVAIVDNFDLDLLPSIPA
jgi:hypothetical protein